ncbi:MAG TPA: lipoyl(octanoyl) transferase LipB [Chthonomonadaceae bacterium]|nr:lipoyl(octanoyl) transferase LipB [Chthonomonadaceae bacterium]
MQVLELGCVPYAEALDLQIRLGEQRRAGEIPDTLLLLEHPPTITLGRNADRAHVVASAESLDRLGIAVVETDRGGDVTYHGPGQLVGYPILDLARPPHKPDLHRYFRLLEECLIAAIGEFGIAGRRFEGYTGVWVEGEGGAPEKIAAMGIRVSRWITRHGFALNVCPDLEHFRTIVPCGIRDYGVTSMERALGRPVSVEHAVTSVVAAFESAFESRVGGD